MDLEFMVLDTFDNLRPKQAPKVNSLQESVNACARIRKAEKFVLNSGALPAAEPGVAHESVVDVISHYCYA